MNPATPAGYMRDAVVPITSNYKKLCTNTSFGVEFICSEALTEQLEILQEEWQQGNSSHNTLTAECYEHHVQADQRNHYLG